MASYYVNNRAQLNGDHEVHTSTCTYLPSDRLSLGEHSSCSSAVAKAKQTYKQANGCKFCSILCHTS